VLVYDPTDAGGDPVDVEPTWATTSTSPPVRGGGYKTLTSGNLFVPACVKLWQNPQSADTITILCLGVDGYSTAYYMAPASVSCADRRHLR
jgi:hypothetical protein